MKYLADTNLVSELLKPRPDVEVVRWVDAAGDDLVLSVVTAGELRLGVARLPAGRRRQTLASLVEELIADYCAPELSYGYGTTKVFAEIAARRVRKGEVQSYPDTLLAALAVEHGLVVVTRNTRHFPDLAVLNPWSDAPVSGS